MKYRLLFLDEELEFHDHFKDYVDYQEDPDIEVLVEFPKSSLQEMLDSIFDMSVDAVISDYRLNEFKIDIDYNVPYDGIELLEKIQEIRKDFPCFIMTAFDANAVDNSQDVNMVYDKGVLLDPTVEDGKNVRFIKKVLKQIDHYKRKLDNAEKELCDLIEKRSKQDASIEDEKRLIELDNLLENSIDRRGEIPNEFKELSNQNRLSELIKKADEIINKYETIS